MGLKEALSFIGTLMSMLSSVAPIPGITRHGKKRAFEMLPVPFLYLSHATQCLWLLYSILIEDPGLIFVNAVTYVLTGICLFLYIHYRGEMIRFIPMYTAAALMAVSFVPALVLPRTLGMCGMMVNIVSSLSPLDKIKLVLKTRDKSYIDIVLSTGNLTSGAIWTLYGLLIADLPTTASSGISFLSNLAQVSVYTWTHCRRQRPSNNFYP